MLKKCKYCKKTFAYILEEDICESCEKIIKEYEKQKRGKMQGHLWTRMGNIE